MVFECDFKEWSCVLREVVRGDDMDWVEKKWMQDFTKMIGEIAKLEYLSNSSCGRLVECKRLAVNSREAYYGEVL